MYFSISSKAGMGIMGTAHILLKSGFRSAIYKRLDAQLCTPNHFNSKAIYTSPSACQKAGAIKILGSALSHPQVMGRR